MKLSLSIIVCKLIKWGLKICKRDGSVFPGSIAYKIDKDALKKIKYPKDVIVVTGSSGKGSTVSVLYQTLVNEGKKVICNRNGSNINNAIMTLLLNNTNTFTHKVNGDVLLLEMDERFISKTFDKGIITTMLITNITRDQPSRNFDSNFIFDKIMESVDKNVHLIVNADDPLLNRVKTIHQGKITTYGIGKNKYATKKTPDYSVDSAYCPKCKTKLKYNFYHYGNMGKYACDNCDFERGKVDFEATNVDLEKGTIKINGNSIKLNKKIFFAVYYTLAAYTVLKTIGIKEENIIDSFNNKTPESKRLKHQYLDGRKVEMIESKNENSLSYLQSLNYIVDQKDKKTVIMGFENVSRRYVYNDLSWLWDVPFEILKDDSIEKIFLIGRFKYDILTRLEYAEIDMEKIVLVDEIHDLLDEVANQSTSPIYTMVCFDMTEIITNMLKERNNEKENN